MNNISAAIGLSQIDHFQRIINKHKENAKNYYTRFKNNKNIRLLKIDENSEPSFWVYTMLLKENVNRDKVLESLNSQGINAGLVHIPNHNYTCFKNSYVDLPNTNYFHENQISLPCGWWLDEKDIIEISECVSKTIERFTG